MNLLYHCCLSLFIGVIGLSHSAALSFATHPIVFPQSGSHILWIAQGVIQPEQSLPSAALPKMIQQAIFQDLSQHTGKAPNHFQIVTAQEHTWPDGCLGLATPEVFCTMALVKGWKVQVSDGSQTWTYRTDAFGDIVKLEPLTTPNS